MNAYATRARVVLLAALAVAAAAAPTLAAEPAGEVTVSFHVTLAPAWFDPPTVRFTLKEPWPDFMTFYGTTATAAGIVLPKKYFESVGPDGFKQKPIGAGPYRFLSQRPGLEIVLEANTAHWRHAPYIRKL